ncbi:MAG: HAD family hydrolase [Thaumarchaeota archaeon]|nr:MAG: HAD family hydrolase [Nitrososphaerota archaeon]
MKVKMISFDVWGTILNLDLMLKSFIDSLNELIGGDVSEDVMMVRKRIKELRKDFEIEPGRDFELSQKLLAERLNLEIDVIRRAAAEAMLKINESMVMDGMHQVLRFVEDNGLRSVIIGNVMFWPSSYTRLILERFRLAEYFNRQYYSDEVGAYKPMKEIFLKPLSEFGVSPCEAVHVGDSFFEDFRGALDVGLHAVLISRRSRPETIGEMGFVIEDVRELITLLKTEF